MTKRPKNVLERQLAVRAKLWPKVTDQMLWNRTERTGFITLPRTMPLMMSIMDDLSGKGFPVGNTYLELWCRLRDELFLTLNKPDEMAFHAGFAGQRAVRTWRDRVKRLVKLGFLEMRPGPTGEMSYALFLNPYHVLKCHYLLGEVNEARWQALVMRSMEIGASDLDDIDDDGELIAAPVPPIPAIPPTAPPPRKRIAPKK